MKVKKDNLRERLLKKINTVSDDKLGYIEEFVDNFRNEEHSKDKSLSFSGQWKDMDDEIFEDLTKNLHHKRGEGRSRIYE